MIERREITETQPQETALDTRWYPRLAEFGSFEAYDFFTGNKEHRDEQKRAFLAGEIRNPILDYPKLGAEGLTGLAERKENLLTLKRDILSEESNQTVRQLYKWKINEKLAEIGMLQASGNGDMHAFRRYGVFIYGAPSQEVFGHVVGNIREQIKDLKKDDREKVHLLTQRLNKNFRKNHTRKIKPPSEDIFQAVRFKTQAEFSEILKDVNEFGYSGREIAQVLSQALETIGADGWTVQIDESIAEKIAGTNITTTGVNVLQEERVVRVPLGRNVFQQGMRALLVHEIGTHVLRRINGEKSKLLLLGLGLDRYEAGEEGVGKVREQALDGEIFQYSLPERQLAIALAFGTDGKRRDFRQVFELMTDYFTAQHVGHKKFKDALEISKNQAYDLCVRVFRGTDCKTKGVCFLKDKGYTEGNVNVWPALEKNPDEIDRLSIGKYDPSNERHQIALTEIFPGQKK